MHNSYSDTTQVPNRHIAHFSYQLKSLISAYKQDTKPRTPIRWHILQAELALYPDQMFVHELIHNLQYGCNISYTGPQFSHCKNNLPSSFQHPTTLDDSITAEIKTPLLPNFHCSGLGLVPKHDGGWCAIYHLSAPYGSSINDFIDPDAYTLSYCTVDDAFAIVSELGKGTLMAKIYLRNAFCLIPIRPEDWNLLGIQWRNHFYIDTCLPFGLRFEPFLFNQLANAIHWFLQNNHCIHHLLHYLDDFFTAGSPSSAECSNNIQAMLLLCVNINAPVKTSKIEGPSIQRTFLGIVIDTDSMTAGISPERKEDLLSLMQFLTKKNKCTKHQLLSLVGKLSFACKVVPAGRIFLRRLINLSCTVSHMHHDLRLCSDAYLGLDWWLAFLPTWNGTSHILETYWSISPSMSLFTDASGILGWGACW